MRLSYFMLPTLIPVIVLMASPFATASALTAREVGVIAESITVRIDGQNSGSGVIIHKKGNRYTVLTAAHVVETEDEYHIVTPDDEDILLDYRKIKRFPQVDLAVLEFSSSRSYQVAEIGDSNDLRSGDEVYVSGFPIPSATITEPIWTFSPGEVTANASHALADGYAVVHNCVTRQGMSGGALLNEKGQLVAIHGRGDGMIINLPTSDVTDQRGMHSAPTRVKSGFNLAIPINTYRRLVAQVQPNIAISKPAMQVTSKPKTADDWFIKGIENFQNGIYREALADWNRTVYLQRDYADAYYSRGLANVEIGNYQTAITNFTKAMQLKSDFAFAYIGRGVAHYKLEDYRTAAADYTKSIQLNPDFSISYYNRGLTYLQLGDHQTAIADYTKAIKLNPDFFSAYYDRGYTHLQLGNYRTAIADYTKAIKLSPDFSDAYYNRGLAHVELGDYRTAIDDFTKTIQLNTDFAFAYTSRGVAHVKLGDYQKSTVDYTKAIQLNPDSAIAHYNRGLNHLAVGDYRTAIADLEMAATLFDEQGNQARRNIIIDKIRQLRGLQQ